MCSFQYTPETHKESFSICMTVHLTCILYLHECNTESLIKRNHKDKGDCHSLSFYEFYQNYAIIIFYNVCPAPIFLKFVMTLNPL